MESLQRNMVVNPVPGHIDPSSLDRLRRSVDISIVLAQTVSNFFIGVSSIFHMASKHTIEKSVRNLAFKQQKFANFTSQFSQKIESVIQTMNQCLNLSKRQSKIAMSLYIIMDRAKLEGSNPLKSYTSRHGRHSYLSS